MKIIAGTSTIKAPRRTRTGTRIMATIATAAGTGIAVTMRVGTTVAVIVGAAMAAAVTVVVAATSIARSPAEERSDRRYTHATGFRIEAGAALVCAAFGPPAARVSPRFSHVVMNSRGKLLLSASALVASACLSGCAWFTRVSRTTDARQRESEQTVQERKFADESAIAARARQYERQGMDSRAAQTAAEIEYAKTGRK